jgi:hypothetical protein
MPSGNPGAQLKWVNEWLWGFVKIFLVRVVQRLIG